LSCVRGFIEKGGRGDMKKILLLLVVVFTGISCSTGGNRKCLEINKQLTSENRLLRSKISLLQRENSVYKYENIQYRKDLENRIAESEKLESEMASLKEKFRGDISLWEEKYSNLTKKNEILERESSEKIQELTELNRQLEQRFSDEIKKLTQSIRSRDEEFGRDREQMKKVFAEDRFNLAKGLEDVKKNIALLEKEKSEMKIRINEISLQLENALREIEEKNTLIRELKKDARLEGIEGPESKGKEIKKP
jgi:chromosome segregation ATPase